MIAAPLAVASLAQFMIVAEPEVSVSQRNSRTPAVLSIGLHPGAVDYSTRIEPAAMDDARNCARRSPPNSRAISSAVTAAAKAAGMHSASREFGASSPAIRASSGLSGGWSG